MEKKRRRRGATDAKTPSAPNRKDAARGTSPARKTVAELKTREERVLHCARLMARGRWHGYPTRERLAKLWGLEEVSVRHIAAEAHRVVAFDPAEREQLRRTAAATLARIAREAERRVSRVSGLPDWNAAISAHLHALECAGVKLDDDADMSGDNGVAMRVVADDVTDGVPHADDSAGPAAEAALEVADAGAGGGGGDGPGNGQDVP